MSLEIIKIILNNLKHPFLEHEINIANEGYNNQVFLIKNLNLAIKIITKSEENAKNEIAALEFIKKSNFEIPVPKIIQADFSKKIIPYSFVVMDLIPGVTLKEYVVTGKDFPKIFYELGELKGKINLLKNTEECYFNANKDNDLIQSLEKEWEKIKDNLLNQSFDKDFVDNQSDFFEKNAPIFNEDTETCFTHGDTSLNNILIESNHISGIIDFEYAGWGKGIKDLFSSIRGFEIFYKYKGDIIKGYSKHMNVPENWEILMYLYQWFANIKALSQVQKMSWRDLSKDETEKRKIKLKENYVKNCKKYMEMINDFNTS